MTSHRTRAELDTALPHIEDAPKDGGVLDLIVVRPDHGQRACPEEVSVSAEGGVAGDHWAKGCWLTDAEGNPERDVQICIMASRAIEAIAGPKENWAPAGDNLFIDLDLSPENMPTGTEFTLGTARFVVTAEPHTGCKQFAERYGQQACAWVNTGPGKALRLRGIYARVLQDGLVTKGDRLVKAG